MIDQVPLFGELDKAQLDLVWACMVPAQFQAGDHLYEEGEPAQCLFLIKSGWVRLRSDQLGVFASSSQGSVLGDADALLGHNYGTTAEAATDVEAWSLSVDKLVQVVAQEPEIGLKFSAIYRASVMPLIRYLVEHRLRMVPGFSDLPDNVLTTLAGRLCVSRPEAGTALFSAGQMPTSLFIIDEGRVALEGPQGRGGEYGPGEVIAEQNLLLGRAHTLTARAATACRLWELSAIDLDRLSGLYPELGAVLSRVLQTHLDSATQSRAAALLRATPLFQGASSEALAALAARLIWELAPAGTRIFEPDTQAEAMYLVDGGNLELLDRQGDLQGHINAGGYCGEIGLLGYKPYGMAAVARSNSSLWVLERADFQNVAERFPAVAQTLKAQLLADETVHAAERHLRRLSLFAGLSTDQLRDVTSYLHEEHFRAGQVLYQRGAPGEALFIIEQGRVSVQHRDPNGEIRVLAAMGPGDFLGENAVLNGEAHASDAFAQSETSAWTLTRPDFETLLTKYPILALNLSRALSYRLAQTTQQAALATGPAIPAPPAGAAVPPASVAPARPVAPPTAIAPARQGTADTVVAPARPAAAPLRRPGVSPVRDRFDRVVGWFNGLNSTSKVRFTIVALLVLWLVGVSMPSLVISVLAQGKSQRAASGPANFLNGAGLIAQAAVNVEAIATWTPWPTDTPIPSPTALPEPTATPTRPPTATWTPVPATATSVPPTQTPVAQGGGGGDDAAAMAVAAPTDAPTAAPTTAAKQYQLISLHHLTPCENVGKHDIFVSLQDPSGNPVDGVKFMFRAADWGAIQEVLVTGVKGPGKVEYPIYKSGQYMTYVTEDGTNPANSDVVDYLGSVRDQTGALFPSGDMCPTQNGGNTWGHNSYQLVFQKNW
jgi:CRP-like cAMP-binding protein